MFPLRSWQQPVKSGSSGKRSHYRRFFVEDMCESYSLKIIQESPTLSGESNLIRDETREESEGFFEWIGFEEL